MKVHNQFGFKLKDDLKKVLLNTNLAVVLKSIFCYQGVFLILVRSKTATFYGDLTQVILIVKMTEEAY